MPKKLKRFLLQYEPPGIGLQIQAGQEEETLHKDLPPLTYVTTPEDICRIVDELIESEPGMLTRRRHRGALLKLLGRLYQVDVPLEDDAADGARKPKAGNDAAPAAASEIQEDQMVVLVALQGKIREYNGELATVCKARPEKDRYEVRLARAEPEQLKVKSAQCVPLAPQGTLLALNTHVVIRGLKNHQELNGCLGVITKCAEDQARFEVAAIESNQLFRVKQDNLMAVSPQAAQIANFAKENGEPNVGAANKAAPPGPAPPGAEGGDLRAPGEIVTGSTVRLHSLKSAATYNGQIATVLSVDKGRNRFEIKLNDGSVKTIRAENVALEG